MAIVDRLQFQENSHTYMHMHRSPNLDFKFSVFKISTTQLKDKDLFCSLLLPDLNFEKKICIR